MQLNWDNFKNNIFFYYALDNYSYYLVLTPEHILLYINNRYLFLLLFQDRLKTKHPIFTAWNANLFAPTPTRSWLTEDNIKNWTAFRRQDSKNLLQAKFVGSKIVSIAENKRTITAWAANMLCLAWPKCQLISTGIWKVNSNIIHSFIDSLSMKYNVFIYI